MYLFLAPKWPDIPVFGKNTSNNASGEPTTKLSYGMIGRKDCRRRSPTAHLSVLVPLCCIIPGTVFGDYMGTEYLQAGLPIMHVLGVTHFRVAQK